MKSLLYGEVIKIKIHLEKFASFVEHDALLSVQSTVSYTRLQKSSIKPSPLLIACPPASMIVKHCLIILWNCNKDTEYWICENHCAIRLSSPCFGRHVKPLVLATFAVVSTHLPPLACVLGYGPFVIHEEGLGAYHDLLEHYYFNITLHFRSIIYVMR
jgi:hypothetical protein